MLALWATKTPFSPAGLFAGTAGVWLDPSDLSTMFQDSAGTTPVTAAGQSVSLIKDKSGNGFNLSQATLANAPTYQIDGNGKPCLSFNGTSSFMLNAGVIAGNTQSMIGAAIATNSVGGYLWAQTTTTTDRIGLQIANSANNCVMETFNGTTATPISGTGLNTAQVLFGTIDKVTPSVTLRQNAVDKVGTTAIGNAPFATVMTTLGARTSGSVFMAGNVYGFLQIARALTLAERAALETYMGAACGIVL